jgi:tetraacyldisaccharide 4'-kinase
VEGAYVVCVGNIVVGGTGKTPLILKLLEELAPNKAALLSRGYKKPKHPRKGTWEEVGDEPALIQQRFPQVSLYIDPDRVRSARKAVSEGHRLILMDDGMQHLRLKKDVVICTVDGEDPYGGGAFLPWGRLRDCPEVMDRADLIVVKGPTIGKGVRMKMVLRGDVRGKVAIFCGVGKPKQFKKNVEEMGCEVVSELILGDHERASEKKLGIFAEESAKKGAKMLLCTEKDVVKLSGYPKFALPIQALRADLTIVEGADLWKKMIQRIKNEAMG